MTHTALFVQEACYTHQFIRSKDDSAIVERPERLRSVALGLAAAIARLEEINPHRGHSNPIVHNQDSQKLEQPSSADGETDDLTKALNQLSIDPSLARATSLQTNCVRIIKSTARLNLSSDAAVKFIHGDIDG
jgi:histone deacetylase HOS3